MLDSLIVIKPLGRSGYFEEHYVYRFYTMVVGNRNIGQCIDKNEESFISFGQSICCDRSLLSISSLVNATFSGTGKTFCIQKHVPYCAVTVKVGHVIDFDAPLSFYLRNSRGSVSWHQNQIFFRHGLQFQVICLRCMLKLTVQHSVQKIKGGTDTANKGILHVISGKVGTTLLDC